MFVCTAVAVTKNNSCSKNLFVLNHWFIVGKTAVDCCRQCKYYVTLTQKAFALLLTRTCKHWLSLKRLTDFERLGSVKRTDAVDSNR